AIATVALTLLLGRFFCGWLCPFGTMHHFIGYLGSLGRSVREKITVNRYLGSQRTKYYILLILLAPAACALLVNIADSSEQNPLVVAGIICILAIATAVSRRAGPLTRRPVAVFFGLAAFW